MATELEVKAQERRELLNEIKRRNASRAKADESVRAADEGQYPGVDPVKKGPFDNEIDQGQGNEDPTVSAIVQEPTFLDFPNALDLSKRGLAYLVQRRYPALIAADMATSIIPKVTKEALSETLNKPFFPSLSNKFREVLGFEPQYVMNADGSVSMTGAGNFDKLQMTKVGNEGSNVVNKLPQKEVKVRGDGKPDLSKMETVGGDGKIYVNINGKAILKDDVILNTSVDSSGRTRYSYSLKTGAGKFLNPQQDDFLLNVVKQRLDEGQAFNTVRGSLIEYIKKNPNLLKKAEELGIDNLSNSKIQDRLKIIFDGKVKNITDESQNLINEILKFKPLKKGEGSAFLSYLRGNKTINNIISADKNIDKGTLFRYLDFIRKSSPKTKRPVEGKFENFMNDFKLEIKDLKNTDSIFYKQYEYFKKYDKIRDEVGKKINPFLNKIFPSTSDKAAKNSVQIAHRFENTQIGNTVGEGLAGTGGTPSAFYLDISKINKDVQPLLENQLRKAISEGNKKAINKISKNLADIGSEVTINGKNYGGFKSLEEKLLNLTEKYTFNPKLMKEDGITLEMMRDVQDAIDMLSKGAGDLGIAMMAKGGLVGISHLTRPLGNF